MINTSKAKWELSPEEKYAVKWFEKNGFDGILEKQYISKTIFVIEKDGFEDKFELPQGIKKFNDVEKYMTQYAKTWDMMCDITKQAF